MWQKAHQFVLGAYRLSSQFPETEKYGLTTQFRRAAVSVPANIAEGFRRRGHQDKIRMINIAQASLEECRYYLILCRDLHYVAPEALMDLVDEVGRMLNAHAEGIRSRHT